MEYARVVRKDVVTGRDGHTWLIRTKRGAEYSYDQDRRVPHLLEVYPYNGNICGPALMQHKSIAHLSSDSVEKQQRPTIIHQSTCEALKRFSSFSSSPSSR